MRIWISRSLFFREKKNYFSLIQQKLNVFFSLSLCVYWELSTSICSVKPVYKLSKISGKINGMS